MGDMIRFLQGINAQSFICEEDRKEAVREVHALLSRIESPWDTTSRLTRVIPTQMAALKIAIDLGLFERWINKNNGVPIGEDELLRLVPCAPDLFTRVIKHLTATNVLWVDKQGLYEMTPLARSLVDNDLGVVIESFYVRSMPLCLHLPDFIKKIGYQNPIGDQDCCRDWCGLTFWEMLTRDPDLEARFGGEMKASSKDRGIFSDTYPCEQLGCETGDVLVVDVGGSLGHDLHTFKARHPDIPGRLVLQDRPKVIANAKKLNGLHPLIELQNHDFFTAQPVAGASIYLLHSILHDWPEPEARMILKNLKPAMKRKHSKVLIHEMIMPSVRPPVEITTRDWVMLCSVSGLERTEEQWRKLVSSSGLKISKVWRSSVYPESVIEVELA